MLIHILFCLFFLIPNSMQENCGNLFPSKSKDCVLSESDKLTYKYCCFKKYTYDVQDCTPYTEADYQKDKASPDPYVTEFKCNDESVTALPEVT